MPVTKRPGHHVPSLQKLPRIRCTNCGGKRVIRYTHHKEWLYYRCNNKPLCVDPETMAAHTFKVLAV